MPLCILRIPLMTYPLLSWRCEVRLKLEPSNSYFLLILSKIALVPIAYTSTKYSTLVPRVFGELFNFVLYLAWISFFLRDRREGGVYLHRKDIWSKWFYFKSNFMLIYLLLKKVKKCKNVLSKKSVLSKIKVPFKRFKIWM